MLCSSLEPGRNFLLSFIPAVSNMLIHKVDAAARAFVFAHKYGLADLLRGKTKHTSFCVKVSDAIGRPAFIVNESVSDRVRKH